MSRSGIFQRLCSFVFLGAWLGGALAGALGCAVDAGSHAGHAAHGAPSGATCPEGSTLDYASFGAAFLDRYCIDCHSSALAPAARSGAPFGSDYDTLEALHASGLVHVDYVAASGPAQENDFMPPTTSSPAPTRAERNRLGEWLACGAP